MHCTLLSARMFAAKFYSHIILDILINEQGNPDSPPSVQLDWGFTSSMECYEWIYPSSTHSRNVNITNKLEKTKFIDDSDLPNYLLHMDVSIDPSDWERPHIQLDEPHWWEVVARATDWEPHFVTDALPSLKVGSKVELVNFNFFMTTNILLPGNKVIKFEKDPGARFPKDLYVVGHVAKK